MDDGVDEKRRRPWWTRWNNGVIVALTTIIFFPLAFLLVWKRQDWSKRGRWMATGGIGIFGVLLLVAGAQEPTTSDGQDAVPELDPSAESAVGASCEAAMSAAADEPDSTAAVPLLDATTQACHSKEEWLSTARRFPAAMGVTEETFITNTDLEITCYGHEVERMCRPTS